MSQTYDVQAWQEIEAQCGPVGPLGREWYVDTLTAFESIGMPVGLAAAIVTDRIQVARGIMQAGLEAYDGLVDAVQVAGELADEHNAPVTVPHVLTLKVKLARLYHYLSVVAPGADVDVASPEETQNLVTESEAELESWLAAHPDEPTS
jgi:hypothetical protein